MIGRGALIAMAFACCASLSTAGAEERLLLEGLADAEAWDTGSRSLVLSRNEGDAALQGRLRLWAAVQITERVQAMALGRFEDGGAGGYQWVETDEDRAVLEQAWIRFETSGPIGLVAQAGRMPYPIGSFSRRYLSSQNPLIGQPVVYDLRYPHAIQITMTAGPVDVTAAAVDRPLMHQIYLEEPDASLRPALAAGVTPVTGLRFGAYATWGPYLSRGVRPYLYPGGGGWRDYRQRVTGLELAYSRGHFELNAEMTRSLFEMPGEPDERGVVWYLEPKYTWSPRWFSALRLQRNEQTSVWLPWGGGWYVTDEGSWDVEAGTGFRISPDAVIKVSYRVERSAEYPSNTPVVDHALALQLSTGFDVRSWLDRPR